MEKIHFRYKKHPGDFLRSCDITELPDPNDNFGDFLVWFLDRYQSDDRIAYTDNLSKLLNDEFVEDSDRLKFIETIGVKSNEQIIKEISLLDAELQTECYKNFYHLVLNGQIEIIENGK